MRITPYFRFQFIDDCCQHIDFIKGFTQTWIINKISRIYPDRLLILFQGLVVVTLTFVKAGQYNPWLFPVLD